MSAPTDSVVMFSLTDSIKLPAKSTAGIAVDIRVAASFVSAFLSAPLEACTEAEVRFNTFQVVLSLKAHPCQGGTIKIVKVHSENMNHIGNFTGGVPQGGAGNAGAEVAEGTVRTPWY